MEPWQKAHIRENYVALIKNTDCNVSLLSHLEQHGVLSEEDAEEISLPSLTPHKKSKLLYEKLFTRRGAFEELLNALEIGRQSGALRILQSCGSKHLNHQEMNSMSDLQVSRRDPVSRCVYRGHFDGRHLERHAVWQDQERARKEAERLTQLEHHETIVSYFFEERIEAIPFTSNSQELCFVSLQDEIEINIFGLDPVYVLRHLTKGIAYLHQNQLIHGNIKPENILLTEDGQVKVSDIWASGLYQESHEREWMAPEILRKTICTGPVQRSNLTQMADIFALGCVFFFLLTRGKHPFGKAAYRTRNILENSSQVAKSQLAIEWKNEISGMISDEPSSRPTCKKLLRNGMLVDDSRKNAVNQYKSVETPILSSPIASSKGVNGRDKEYFIISGPFLIVLLIVAIVVVFFCSKYFQFCVKTNYSITKRLTNN